MTQVNFKNDLRVFNEKVGELESSSFFAKASGAGYIVEFKHEQGWDALFVGPDEESIKALVLTLRLFMQNNDRLSLQKMRALYKSPPVSAGLVAEFSHLCDQLNQFLDSATGLSIKDGHQLTFREILDIFLYGTYAHVNERHRSEFEGIRTTPVFPIFQTYLVRTLEAFGRCLRDLRSVNEKALQEL